MTTAIRGALTAQEAERMPARIAGSRRAEAYKERPDVTARRVAKLETELRALDRKIAGLNVNDPDGSEDQRQQYESEHAVLVERINGDKAVLQQAAEDGRFGQYTKANVHKDDQVKIRGQWRQVVCASTKSVSVATGYSWTDRYGYEEIRDQRCPHTEDDGA
ncbi:hypothetical protein [Streptomyces sp. NPDC059262]|uniref:hypothetical protein n=1 Tax=Streptomyces sp. NPDC059262 TaxID=3346797 RepID=UPI0036A90AF8